MVEQEHQTGTQNRGSVEAGAGEEAHQKKASEVVAGRSIEVEAVAAERLIEVRVEGVVHLIEAKVAGVVHLIEVVAEGEEARYLLTGEEVQDGTKPGVMEEHVMLVERVFSVVMAGEGFQLLVVQNVHEIVAFLWREAGVELHLDLALEVVLYFSVP